MKKDQDEKITMNHIKASPEKYIEINMIRKDRLVDNFFIFADKDSFIYEKDKKKVIYKVDPEYVYLIPTTKGYFLPSAFYKQGKLKPRKFTYNNKGIPCNAFTLLYDLRLYKLIVQPEVKNLNFILIVFSLIILIMYGITTYFHLGGSL